MSGKNICTVEQLKDYLKANLSEKRYEHVLGVADTTEMVLKHYCCRNYVAKWNGFSAGIFCGLAHDIAREMSPETWLEYIEKYNVQCDEDEKACPVLLHGYVSAILIKQMFENVPESWLRAIEVHTLGDTGVDDLAIALFIADFIEPGRTYLTDQQRKNYLSCKTIQQCAYTILCDIMKHQKEKGSLIAKKSFLMLDYLGKK